MDIVDMDTFDAVLTTIVVMGAFFALVITIVVLKLTRTINLQLLELAERGEELKEAKQKLHEAIPREHRKYERRSNNPMCGTIHVSPYDISLQILIDCLLDHIYSTSQDQIKKGASLRPFCFSLF